ncbi:MAG: hypothetical protein R3F65_25365 [bacterium]|nr:hypothetical protein [Myxococcales bacterium]MCB9552193.1 hypothetical protein [Myxococcales bacterium]
MTRRHRRRASDIASVRPRRGLGSLVLLAVALALVILYKVSVSEETAGLFTQIAGEPELQLPPSVLDQPDTAPADAAPDATRDAAPPD